MSRARVEYSDANADPFDARQEKTARSIRDLVPKVNIGEWRSSRNPFQHNAGRGLDLGIRGAKFTHADVKKIALIAFGEGTEDSLRAVAVRQLDDVFSSDPILLETAEASWCVWIAACANSVLANTGAGRGFRTNAAKLLCVLVGRVAVVRRSFALLSLGADDDPKSELLPTLADVTAAGNSYRISLTPVLSIVLLDRLNVCLVDAGQGTDATLEIRTLCAEVLWQFGVCLEFWIACNHQERLRDRLEMVGKWVPLGSQSMETTAGGPALQVPVFLSRHIFSVRRYLPNLAPAGHESTPSQEFVSLDFTPVVLKYTQVDVVQLTERILNESGMSDVDDSAVSSRAREGDRWVVRTLLSTFQRLTLFFLKLDP